MNRSYNRNSQQLNYEIEYRTQFTFTASDQTLSNILNDIAKHSVNLLALTTTKNRDKKNFVRIVAGTTETETNRDFNVVRKTLDSHNVSFKEETIIALLNIPPGVPGVFNQLYGSLWCKVQVKSMYLGENDIVFFNVSNIKKATEILSQEILKRCQSDC
ncbi:hypothetical protein [Gottfriedia solisilvae]|uniref:Uncharacterized protein n=1 Tax=Gottfriedia solisilvae TaxID=1516104 RepID=A0A8J3AKG3_9BACI|nr:hypothetical protein [Gottfriedia solisilvae]GGI15505.1 hypothetical protein GCM10007380_28310 [Gottfriedia solisilvae]